MVDGMVVLVEDVVLALKQCYAVEEDVWSMLRLNLNFNSST